jgi:hypothetical protein
LKICFIEIGFYNVFCFVFNIAAFYGHAAVTKCLCEYGASIEEKNNDGATAFFIGLNTRFFFFKQIIFNCLKIS